MSKQRLLCKWKIEKISSALKRDHFNAVGYQTCFHFLGLLLHSFSLHCIYIYVMLQNQLHTMSFYVVVTSKRHVLKIFLTLFILRSSCSACKSFVRLNHSIGQTGCPLSVCRLKTEVFHSAPYPKTQQANLRTLHFFDFVSGNVASESLNILVFNDPWLKMLKLMTQKL